MPRVFRGMNIFAGCAQIGASGTSFGNLILGATCINAPSGVAGTGFSASIAVPGVDTSSTVFAVPGVCMPKEYTHYTTCPINGGIRLAFNNGSGSQVSASNDAAVLYLAFV